MMKRIILVIGLYFPVALLDYGQEIRMSEIADLDQVYGQPVISGALKSFNEINVESGYVLYETEIKVISENPVLELENVRDFAAVYVDSALQGTITDTEKRITLNVKTGKHKLRIYTENIGRITYGPEILDNSKGLFGSATLDREELIDWTIIPLNVRKNQKQGVSFKAEKANLLPAFHKGFFDMSTPKTTYIDMSGWGMGEVWINGQYVGSFWEKEKLQSIQVMADILKKKRNEIVIFEIKSNSMDTVKLVDKPAFN